MVEGTGNQGKQRGAHQPCTAGVSPRVSKLHTTREGTQEACEAKTPMYIIYIYIEREIYIYIVILNDDNLMMPFIIFIFDDG